VKGNRNGSSRNGLLDRAGIYLPGRFGVRIEDIAVIEADGTARPLNQADHSFATVA